jgi:hypothetical protein
MLEEMRITLPEFAQAPSRLQDGGWSLDSTYRSRARPPAQPTLSHPDDGHPK